MRPGERGSGSRPWREGAEGPEFALASRAEAARGGRAEGGGGPWPRGGRALPGHARRGSLRASGSAVAAVAWLSAAEGSTPALGFPAGRGTSGLGDGRGEAGCSGGLARPLRHHSRCCSELGRPRQQRAPSCAVPHLGCGAGSTERQHLPGLCLPPLVPRGVRVGRRPDPCASTRGRLARRPEQFCCREVNRHGVQALHRGEKLLPAVF